MKLFSCVASAAAVCFAGTSIALAGPDWVEVGDAGPSVETAQVPVPPPGVSQLLTITGNLSGFGDGVADFEDLYFFRVTDTTSFEIRPIAADFDAALYLFNVTVNFDGLGLLANQRDSKSNLPTILPFATDGTGVVITTPGDYVLGIAGRTRFPVSSTGAIFNFASPFEISGPDGPGGFNPLSGWSGPGITGSYTLEFTGSGFPVVPAPGAAIVLLSGAALMARRRR